MDWCTHHVDDPKPYVDDYEDEFESARSVIISPWDRQFFDVENDFVFDIIMAANYLDIELRACLLSEVRGMSGAC